MTAERSIRLHVRIFAEGISPAATTTTLLAKAADVLRTASIRIDVLTNRVVEDRQYLRDVVLSDSEMQEIEAREGVSDTREIVVYLLNSTIPPFNGYSAAIGRPPWTIITTASRSEWILAHELAHLLGIQGHVKDNDCLMTESPDDITNPPPDLNHHELATMQQSRLLF